MNASMERVWPFGLTNSSSLPYRAPGSVEYANSSRYFAVNGITRSAVARLPVRPPLRQPQLHHRWRPSGPCTRSSSLCRGGFGVWRLGEAFRKGFKSSSGARQLYHRDPLDVC